MRLESSTRTWLEVLSELFVGLAAGWLSTVFIVPQIKSVQNINDLISLTLNTIFGILCLIAAEKLREGMKR